MTESTERDRAIDDAARRLYAYSLNDGEPYVPYEDAPQRVRLMWWNRASVALANVDVDPHDRAIELLRDLVGAASCWLQCADVAKGQDRCDCAGHLFAHLETTRAFLLDNGFM
jgi:hypothetical protein